VESLGLLLDAVVDHAAVAILRGCIRYTPAIAAARGAAALTSDLAGPEVVVAVSKGASVFPRRSASLLSALFSA
jgi:hypothetical protein